MRPGRVGAAENGGEDGPSLKPGTHVVDPPSRLVALHNYQVSAERVAVNAKRF